MGVGYGNYRTKVSWEKTLASFIIGRITRVSFLEPEWHTFALENILLKLQTIEKIPRHNFKICLHKEVLHTWNLVIRTSSLTNNCNGQRTKAVRCNNLETNTPWTDKDRLISSHFHQNVCTVSRFLAVRGTESREKQQPVSVLWNQKSISFEISYSRSTWHCLRL